MACVSRWKRRRRRRYLIHNITTQEWTNKTNMATAIAERINKSNEGKGFLV